MKPTDDLFQLINSLSGAEKRYVKIFASKHMIGDTNQYLLLFDTIARQKEYDEDEIKEKFKGKPFIRHLPSEKNYLYRFILKSLRAFHSEHSINITLREMLQDAMLLYQKRLYNQSLKVLDKARKTAHKFNSYSIVIEINQLEVKILIDKDINDSWKKIQKLELENDEALDNLVASNKLRKLRTCLYMLMRNSFSRYDTAHVQEANALINDPVLRNSDTYQYFDQQQYFFECYVFYGQIVKETGTSVTYYQKLLQLWADNEEYIKENTEEYKKHLSNYLAFCWGHGLFEEFPKYLAIIKSIKSATEDEEASTFKNVYYFEFLYHINKGQYNDALKLIPEIETGLKKYNNNIANARKMAFCNNIALLLFIKMRYKECISWLNKILNEGETEVREDIRNFASIFQLIVHYELGNYDLLDYLCRSVLRAFQKKNKPYEFEFQVINMVRRLVQAQDSKDKPQILASYSEQFKALIARPAYKQIMGLQELICWIESKYSHISMEEALRL